MSLSDWSFFKFGKKKDVWPKDEHGEPEKPAFLEHVSGSQIEYDMEVSLLKAYGIPTLHAFPNNGEFGKLILGFSGTGMDIYVPESMLADAQNIISADIEPESEDEYEDESEE